MHVTALGARAFRERAAAVLLLHGCQDTGDTFQFMVDAFERDWPLTALDWRGFGRSAVGAGRLLVSRLPGGPRCAPRACSAPAIPVRLVGHSMGGNIAALYAGVRPQRVRCLVNLEGFGMPRTSPDQAPAQLPQVARSSQVGAAPQGLRLVRSARRDHPLPLSALRRGAGRASSPKPGVDSRRTVGSICSAMPAIAG